MKNFVVVIDTQYDFMMPDGILYVKGAEETIVPMIQYLASLNADTTSGVLFTYDTHTREQYEGSSESELFPIHCEVDTKGHANLINPFIVSEELEVLTLEKPVFDMWTSEEEVTGEWYSYKNLEELFSQDNADFEVVDIIGVALNFCVKQAVDGFVERGFKVRLHTSMTRGIDTGKAGDLDARALFAGEIALGKVIVVD